MWHKRRTVIAGAIAVILTVVSGPAFAAWPEKTVTVVVPYAAGGNTDIMARLATEWLSNRLDQRFIVENRVGAGATLGTAYVAKAGPDGYTVLFGAAPQLLVAPLVQKVTYDARKDFAPVAVFGTGPQVLGISADVPAKNLREFVAYAKANPGKINYASGGVGTAGHLTGALLAARGGLDMVHVPYKGGLPALTDLLAGQVQMYFGNASELVRAQDQRQDQAHRRVAFEADVAASRCRGGGRDVSGLQPRSLEWLRRAGRHAAPDPRIAREGNRCGGEGQQDRAAAD